MNAEELSRYFFVRLAQVTGQLPAGLQREISAAAAELLKRMRLVNREEFETQTQLLQRLAERAAMLEQRLDSLAAEHPPSG